MDKKTLLRVAQSLERTAAELRRAAAEIDSEPVPPKPLAQAAPDIDALKALGRDAAAQRIGSLSQRELGALFVLAGGPARDKKRSKEWLAERILWNLFDFNAGHSIIKG